MPVVANFQMTFQWLRELKRRGYRLARGIQFRIDDTEAVFIGHYNQVPQEMTVAQSIAFFRPRTRAGFRSSCRAQLQHAKSRGLGRFRKWPGGASTPLRKADRPCGHLPAKPMPQGFVAG